MDDSQGQTETQPPAAAGTPAAATPSLGDRVREVREHLERASSALATLNQLLPAGDQDADPARVQSGNRDPR